MVDLEVGAKGAVATRRLSELTIDCRSLGGPDQQQSKLNAFTNYNSSNVSEDTQRTIENVDDPRQYSSTSSSRRQKSAEALVGLRVAEALYAQKRTDECMRVLERDCNVSADPDALFLKAMCCLERNQQAVSLGLLAQALSLHPGHVQSLTTCAEIQKDMGNFGTALEMIDRAHGQVPLAGDDDMERIVQRAYAGILVEAGTAEKLAMERQGSHERGALWEKKYAKALEICPGFAPALYNMGVVASEAGKLDEALEHYRRALESHPGYVEALCNIGVILQHEGRLSEAIEAYEKAYMHSSSSAVPQPLEVTDMVAKNLAMALNHHGTAVKLSGSGNAEEAIRLYERAVAVSPGCAEALYNLGVIYAERGEVNKAIFAYRSTIKENPTCAEAHNNLGVLYRAKGLMGLALQCYEAAIRARPSFPQALNNLAVMYTQQGRAPEALDLLRAAIVADPGYGEAWNNLGVLQRDVGDAEDAIESYKKCLEIEGEKGHRNAGQNMLLGLNYLYDGNEAIICDAHLAWGRTFQKSFDIMEPASKGRNHEKIRVGYVSPDLFVHSVSYFAEAPIKSHNADEFDVTIYSVCVNRDAKTSRLRREVIAAGGRWKDVPELTECQLAKLIREDEIDILIDLTGHTANNRLGTFAMRPAPVQITWIGYPNTTGLTTIDYRITDAFCDPTITTQVFSEQLVRLKNCFLCYTPCPEAPEVAPLPADANGYITFGSFNALAKQTPEVMETWAEILKAIPTARLVLKNKPFASNPVKQKYWQLFERLGVHRSRVDLLPLAPKTESHLEQYSMLDICLDPFPYAGTTTTMEALYMGVPCLTMRGGGHAHNVGVSLVTNVGLSSDQWIAEDKHDYVAKAVKASDDVSGLRRLRRGLRQRVNESSICDVPEFMRDFEARLKNFAERRK